MRLLAILLGASAAISCTRSSPPSERPVTGHDAPAPAPDPEPAVEGRSDAMPTVKDPNAPPPAFTRGRAISPTADLVAWLDQQGDALVRLPFTLTLAKGGSVASAAIGVNGEGGPAVTLTDLGMGISLKDRLRKVCKGGETCAVWLVGVWAAGESRLDVRKMDGVVEDPAAATHAEVETK